jgi:hypothetical protein
MRAPMIYRPRLTPKATLFPAAYLFLAVMLQAGLSAKTTDPGYAVHNIPVLLMIDSDAIIRNDAREFTYIDAGKGRLDVKLVITVMNSHGTDYGDFQLYYSRFSNVRTISGAIYDADGNRVRRLRNRDIRDEPAISSISLADDSRMKTFQLHHDTYPYTIELEYRYDYSGMIAMPSWTPRRRTAAVQNSSYTVHVPSEIPLYHFSKNLEQEEPEKTQINNMTAYTWKVENLPVLRRQPMGPDWEEVAPLLMIRTPEFEIGRERGSMESWQTFGSWVHQLWFGRDELPEDVKNDILKLVDGLESESDIIDTLYRFLQQNTRYVSIQLGIGGWQTETAANTVRTRYGDCKALTNYMRSLLRVAGIESYPALIRNGRPPIDIVPEFPNARFNHVILCIPTGADTLWVECTSKAFPAGYIGLNNAGKHVLVFNENGGELVKTPDLTHRQNFQRRKALVRLQDNGHARSTVTTEYGGAQHETVRYLHLQSTPGEQERYVTENIGIPVFDVTSFRFRETGEAEAIALDLELDLPSLASSSGTRMFLTPNLMERRTTQLAEVTGRTQPVRLIYPYSDLDEIEYHLPQGYSIEVLPARVHLQEDFGEFLTEIGFDEGENRLRFTRLLELREKTLPAERYEDFRQFMNTVSRVDAAQVVLVRDR